MRRVLTLGAVLCAWPLFGVLTATAAAAQLASGASPQVTSGPASLFGNTTPSTPDGGPDSSVQLGLRFHTSEAGNVLGVRFYKSSANTGTHVGTLFDASGNKLAQATFANETASGWQDVQFSQAVAIKANTEYTVAYHSAIGHYADDQYYAWPKATTPLTGDAGLYCYGDQNCFPSSTWNGSNYYVDLDFQATGTAPQSPSNTAVPRISGTAQVGATLTTDNGTWTGSTPITYSYQWQHCTSSGCQDISGATGSSYQIQSSDAGTTIDARVTAANSAGSATATSAQTQTVSAPPPAAGLHVVGNQLQNAGGTVIRLHGFDRAGPEYACIQGWGFFDNSNSLNDDNSPPLMAAWHANEESVDLNEDCWLGINGVPSQYGGQNYINAITHDVKTIEANGMYPVLNLQWSAPGSQQATGQSPMPDNDHSPAFWQSVAETFKGDPNVVLRLQEEPYPAGNTDTTAAWQCWGQGDVQYGTSNNLVPVSKVSHCSEGYPTVGMQSLINIIRGTGATNVIEVPGLEYANDMTHFLDSGIRVSDTLNPSQLMAVVDTYPAENTCGSTSCYNSQYAPVAAVMPFEFGEFGPAGSSNCSTAGVDALMSWADAHGAGYSAWSWDTWGGCNQLITSYSTGAPTSGWGSDYKNHLMTTFP